MTTEFSTEEKAEKVDKLNEKTNEFLKTRVDKIAKAIGSDDYDLIWNKPVFTVRYMNPITNVMYNIENTILLTSLADEKNYDFPFYFTAKQGYAAGMSNKGEKSDFIINRFGAAVGFIKDKDKEKPEPGPSSDEETGGKVIYRRASKLTPIFNLSQFTGEHPAKVKRLIELLKQKPTPDEVETIFEALVETMPTPLKRVSGSNHYRPGEDVVSINPSSHFKSRIHEFNTLAHEIAHSYGHESRKNRASLRHYGENLESRAYEKLVANLAAQAVIKHYGLHIDPATRQEIDESFMQNHTAYDVSWARIFKDDALKILEAAKDADRTASTIIHEMNKSLTMKYKSNPDLKISELVKDILEAKAHPEEKPEAANDSQNKIYKKSKLKRQRP